MQPKTSLPRLPGNDHTPLFLNQGHEVIHRGCNRF